MTSKKTEKKMQQRVIEDRTFGLKNKNKSKAVQKFVKGVENTVKNAGQSAAFLESMQLEAKKAKKEEEKEQALLDALYKTVDHVKAAAALKDQDEDADPKSIVCPFFKQGLCQKGKKCKYSHDLTLDRGEELDLYVDQRTQLIMNDQNQKQMNEWDEEKLMQVIKEKEKNYIKQKPTQIVCKYFLDAVQKSKYGWNWQCPNGLSCHYKHCLPVGYVLRKHVAKNAQQEQQSVQKQIDEARQKIGSKGQLVTLQIFLKWKQQKRLKKLEQVQQKKKDQQKKGKAQGKQHVLSGKALFQYDPTLFVDDDQAADENIYDNRQEQEQQQQQYQQENEEIEPEKEQIKEEAQQEQQASS